MKRILRSHLTEVDAHFGTHTVIPEDSINEVCEELVAALAELSKPPDHATRYGHCSGCKTGGTHYLGSIEHPDPDEHLPDDQYLAKKQERFAANPQSDEDPAPVLVALSEAEIDRIASEQSRFVPFDKPITRKHSYYKAMMDGSLEREEFIRGLRHANTRAVSVDQLVEVAEKVSEDYLFQDGYLPSHPDLLREAFAKLVNK